MATSPGVNTSKALAYGVLKIPTPSEAVSKLVAYAVLQPLVPVHRTPEIGYTSTFAMGAGSPVVYLDLAEIVHLDFFDYEVPQVDVTHGRSPRTTEESIPSIVRPGTVEIICNYIGDESQQQIDELAVSRTIFPWKLTAPASDNALLTVLGRGFISKKESGPFEAGKKIDLKLTVKTAGSLNYSVALL
jgi:hypothetical protein